MAHDSYRDEPQEIEVFYPESVELIDPRHPEFQEASVVRPRRRPRFFLSARGAALLFVATCLSTLQVRGPYYAVAIMTILLAHEMGHYLQARRYGVPASFPYFIPLPFISPFGTMGAVIVQGAGVANRKMLFDIAVSGPLAGLVIALPVTYYGIQHATFVPEAVAKERAIKTHEPVFGQPLVFTWMVEAIHGPIPKGMVMDDEPLIFAGWVGIFITALNLIPIGQLDGGHMLYTLIGRRAHLVARLLLLGAVAYMIYSRDPAYGLMAVLLFVMGPRHPPTADDRVPLGWPRIALGWATLAFIFIGFTPHPISNFPSQHPAPRPPKHAPAETKYIDNNDESQSAHTRDDQGADAPRSPGVERFPAARCWVTPSATS